MKERDLVTIEDEYGNERDYEIEALFEMNDQSYALLTATHDTFLVKVDGANHQFISGVTDPHEKQAVLDAYLIAVEASPAE
jgi:uncharacterized protein YrzB (UPF0473 family)